MYLATIVLLLQSRPTLCGNVLGVFTFPSISHQLIYQPLWKELSLKGHNVTVLTPDPLNHPSLTNLTELSIRFTYDFLKQTKLQNLMSKDFNILQSVDSVYRFMDAIAEVVLNSTVFKQLIDDQARHFDLILIDCFHPSMYALAGRFKAPIIGVAPCGMLAAWYDSTGNPTHPVLHPDILLKFHDNELSLWQKTKSVVFGLWTRYYYHGVLVPRVHGIVAKHLENLGYLMSFEKNQSMRFLNLNPAVYPPRANVPAVVEAGLGHIQPVKPLPEDLQKVLDGATEGVVYVSLGSNIRSVDLDARLRKVIVEALSELPYKVLWKWESDCLLDRPKNVVTRKWYPQQDILAHPNVRAFVTQGGLQSTGEAISRGVPLIGMPFMSDQPMNVQKIVKMGIGLGVDPVSVSKEELKGCIIEVVENQGYKRRIHEVRNLWYDIPMTGLDRAVWWSEYVIKHKGAKHLRSPAADISWCDYFLVDVVLTTVLVISGTIYLVHKVIQLPFITCYL
ncbi:hypothetical protein Zmor_028148 [Zophobas morio]|uniref:UDP-glucuronosyltransferase n=1 Tax=Zophobas morio TaxID=2755281 RepID=A0AA38M2Q6_9CUCU|nr:hypothetical protein Zmor_028148 [Zophobas morio]